MIVIIVDLLYLLLLVNVINGYSYKYVGCFEDREYNVRALPIGHKKYWNSPADCAQICGSESYRYFGLQRGYQCWCGNSGYDRYGLSPNCYILCLNDIHSICGGLRSNSVYELDYPTTTTTTRAIKPISSLTPTMTAIHKADVIHGGVAPTLATFKQTAVTQTSTTLTTTTPTTTKPSTTTSTAATTITITPTTNTSTTTTSTATTPTTTTPTTTTPTTTPPTATKPTTTTPTTTTSTTTTSTATTPTTTTPTAATTTTTTPTTTASTATLLTTTSRLISISPNTTMPTSVFLNVTSLTSHVPVASRLNISSLNKTVDSPINKNSGTMVNQNLSGTTELPTKLVMSFKRVKARMTSSINDVSVSKPTLLNNGNTYPALQNQKKINSNIGGAVGSAVVGATVTLIVMLVLWRRKVSKRNVQLEDEDEEDPVYIPIPNIRPKNQSRREDDRFLERERLNVSQQKHSGYLSSETTQL